RIQGLNAASKMIFGDAYGSDELFRQTAGGHRGLIVFEGLSSSMSTLGTLRQATSANRIDFSNLCIFDESTVSVEVSKVDDCLASFVDQAVSGDFPGLNPMAISVDYLR